MKNRKNRIDIYVDENVFQWYQSLPTMSRSKMVNDILAKSANFPSEQTRLDNVEKWLRQIQEMIDTMPNPLVPPEVALKE